MRIRYILTVLFFVLMAGMAYAQQFTTHAVKEGETLYGIAQKYKVTPFNILKYNADV